MHMQCDLDNLQVDKSVLDSFCRKNNITAW